MNDAPQVPVAHVRLHNRYSLIWLIPVVAALVAAFLGWRTLAERGPMITITFSTGDGIVAGQTHVEHKAVDLGTVEQVTLSRDMSHVIVRVRMRREATPELTDQARFWVVRPRLSLTSISGLETLVSGSFIEMDPGHPGDNPQREFTGLEEPPGVRSDVPGRTFTLQAGRIGELSGGSPVFYRDVVVGEVLGYDTPGTTGPIAVHIFVRAPYDRYVHQGTHFWNASGLSVDLGAQGLHVELESLQAVLSGGIAFGTPHPALDTPVAADNATFRLYDSQDAAEAAGLSRRIPCVAYFQSSVSGLSVGSPVEFFGLRVGTVTGMQLHLDPGAAQASVRVTFDVQPERVFAPQDIPKISPPDLAARYVQHGLRAQLQSSNLLTGQVALVLDFFPHAASASVGREGDALVLPTQAGGGMQGITNSLSDIVDRLNRLPLDSIGANLNDLLHGLNQTVSGPELKDTLSAASNSMRDLQDVLQRVDAGITPALRRLPEISAQLQDTVARANRLLGSGGLGVGSQFGSSLTRTLDQLDEAARSIRLLADYLNQHPEALIRGRAGGR
jgi:paraquat-inducible protein B